ncbi:MAG: hypothetical protein F4X36_15670 [Gammaproteobacteria bacterium]|nr:hypothetical protein [Gammaproteobacteria bacterium]
MQIRHDLRLYRNQPGDVHKRGLSWSLMRSCIVNGERFSETIISSPEVFDDPEDAKRDALRKLSILRCPLDLPLDRAVKWILDD